MTKVCAENRPRRNRRRRARKTPKLFAPYISEILSKIHPCASISSDAKLIMDQWLHDTAKILAQEAGLLVNIRKVSTLSEKDMKSAAQLIIPGELGRVAICNADQTFAKFHKSKGKAKNGRCVC